MARPDWLEQLDEALADRWPHVQFDVLESTNPFARTAVTVGWEDGPLADEVRAVAVSVTPESTAVSLYHDYSSKSVALGVLLDYQAAGQETVTKSMLRDSFRKQPVSGTLSHRRLDDVDPWLSHPDRDLAEQAQLLAAIADGDSPGSMADKLEEIGGPARLRELWRRTSAVIEEDPDDG